MNTFEVIAIIYLLVGIVLAFIWWNDEYEPQREYDEDYGEHISDGMSLFTFICLVLFWPLKLFKNWVENFVS